MKSSKKPVTKNTLKQNISDKPRVGKNRQGREGSLGFLEDSLVTPTGYRFTSLQPCFSVIASVGFQTRALQEGKLNENHLIKIFLCSLLIAGERGKEGRKTQTQVLKAINYMLGFAALYDLGQVT